MTSALLRAWAASFPSFGDTWLAAGGVTIDFDRTLVAQAILFSVLILILSPLLLKPLLRLFEERERRTEGARAEARAMQERAVELLERYERELDAKQRVAAQEREKIRLETAKLEARILEEAHQATTQIVATGRERIAVEVANIRGLLDAQADNLSRQIASRALGREVD